MTERLSEHADMLGLRPGQALLEVGCGTGKTTAWLAAQVAPGRVTAIDFASEMIARAKGKGIDADFACLDVCRDDLGCARYDVILCFH
ncbi:MAG: class I SAM-dependent methyltransferase, partial [Planctomycetes bacterium]|nr:class I SAM-dependent methyltransferase [Planctomycetota bacterium]